MASPRVLERFMITNRELLHLLEFYAKILSISVTIFGSVNS